MQLAFVLYKYFPFGGLQRDFMRIALECQARGHAIRVYTPIWEGENPGGFDVRVAPVRALFNHRRNEKFSAWLQADLKRDPVDRVIGFNKMPGLDVYYAADGCFEDKAQTLRNPIYRRWGRYKHFADYERAVFAPESKTEILMISEVQQQAVTSAADLQKRIDQLKKDGKKTVVLLVQSPSGDPSFVAIGLQ